MVNRRDQAADVHFNKTKVIHCMSGSTNPRWQPGSSQILASFPSFTVAKTNGAHHGCFIFIIKIIFILLKHTQCATKILRFRLKRYCVNVA